MEWLRIGDVARRTGLTPRTLRHYDDLGLLVPSGRSGGDYRLYGPDDLQRLLAIQHLKSLGLSLDEIGAALDEPEFDAADTLARHIAAVEQRLAAEVDLLERLRRLRDAAGAGWDEVLEVIALTERLRHPDAWVRFRATLDEPTAAPRAELIELLRGDPAPGVREGATWALVQQGPGAVDAVLAQLGDPDPGVRQQMAHVLGKFADARATPALIRLLDDPDADVAAKAAFALGQIGGPDAAAALAGALGRGGAAQRAVVVTALGGLGADATDLLVAALADPDAGVRADAAEALGHLEDPAAVDALAAAAADQVDDVAVLALMALGSLVDRGTDDVPVDTDGVPGRGGAVDGPRARAREALASRAGTDGRVGAVARRLLGRATPAAGA